MANLHSFKRRFGIIWLFTNEILVVHIDASKFTHSDFARHEQHL